MKSIDHLLRLVVVAVLLFAGIPSVVEACHAGTSVHLFEWRWDDIAKECPNLATKGYDSVQVSPPNEHIGGTEWWVRYQPVSYRIISRGGSREEFAAMVERCHKAGVKIYADVVINHTADLVRDTAGNHAEQGVGVAGNTYTRRNHPTVPYVHETDYHKACTIDYKDAHSIQTCQLGQLPDLYTDSESVREKIAGYLRDLLENLKVDGLRVDAAKHIAPLDLSAIYTKAGKPFVYQEVIEAAGEPVRADQYTHLGMVTDFTYGVKLAEKFKQGRIADLYSFGKSDWGLVESQYAVVFVDNHDRERGHGGGGNLTYRDGSNYNLATVFELAWPYGYPNVLSSYKWDGRNDAAGPWGPVDCDNPDWGSRNWVCQHQWGNIANMVDYRQNTVDACRGIGDTLVDYWWVDGSNKIGFGCMDKGYVVINNSNEALNATIRTGMKPGIYCNVLSNNIPCGGDNIEVDTKGQIKVTVQGKNAIAIHVGARP